MRFASKRAPGRSPREDTICVIWCGPRSKRRVGFGTASHHAWRAWPSTARFAIWWQRSGRNSCHRTRSRSARPHGRAGQQKRLQPCQGERTASEWIELQPSHDRRTGAETVAADGARASDLHDPRHVLVVEELDAEVAAAADGDLALLAFAHRREHVDAAAAVEADE